MCVNHCETWLQIFLASCLVPPARTSASIDIHWISQMDVVAIDGVCTHVVITSELHTMLCTLHNQSRMLPPYILSISSWCLSLAHMPHSTFSRKNPNQLHSNLIFGNCLHLSLPNRFIPVNWRPQHTWSLSQASTARHSHPTWRKQHRFRNSYMELRSGTQIHR